MTAINLQKDLELWVDFDSDYWDAQRNQIQDQSGYGRHPTAFGGPTVGVEGPNDFEAASFDGSDDIFKSTDPLISSEFTQVVLAKFGEADSTEEIVSNGASQNSFQLQSDSVVRFRVRDTDGSEARAIGNTVPSPAWKMLVGVFTSDTAKIVVNGRTDDVVQHTVTDIDFTDNFTVGGRPDQGWPFDGEVAFAGRWSRALTDAEIEYLSNLTAPRRSQL